MPRALKTLSRREVEARIAEGETLVIVTNKVLRLDAWKPFHPGGDKAILHMVGRDATDEVNALHSPEARARMANFEIGQIDGCWKNFTPPIQGGKFRKLHETVESDSEQDVEDVETISSRSRSASPIFDTLATDIGEDVGLRLRKLHSASSVSSVSDEETTKDTTDGLAFLDLRTQKEITLDLGKYPPLDPTTQANIVGKYRDLERLLRAKGLFQCNYTAYAFEISRYLLLFSLSMLCVRAGWYVLGGVFLGVFWHQLVFTAHDAGHMGITHNYIFDTMIGIFVADFVGGLSIGWWKRSHNVHHIVTNSPEHDPDIELMPFFAVSHRFFTSMFSTYYDRLMPYDAFAKITIPYQAIMYYPILAFGRFNLYVLSWDYLLRGLGPKKGAAWWHRWAEIAGQCFFWYWFGYLVLWKSIPTWTARVIFVLVSHIVTAPLHVQITLSHYAMSTSDLGPHESFPQKMLRTTMDVDCPPWLDFVHGGLQFQAIHHLYPRMPRHNLRAAQALVAKFCQETDIPYALYGFVEGNKQVLGRLGDVGRQAAIFAACQKQVAAEGLTCGTEVS